MVLDFAAKPDDPELIKQALTMTMPDTVKGFFLALSTEKREVFYRSVMAQKNSDRVLKLFMEEIVIIKSVEDRNTKNSQIPKNKNSQIPTIFKTKSQNKNAGIQSQGFAWDQIPVGFAQIGPGIPKTVSGIWSGKKPWDLFLFFCGIWAPQKRRDLDPPKALGFDKSEYIFPRPK